MSNEHSRIERLTGRERRRIRQALLGFALCVAFYSVQYALRSAPTVMLADLARAFNISSVDVGDLSSIFLYTYAIFALISGTVLDRFGARAAVPCGAAITAFGALLFVLDGFGAAEVGRLLQGAGSAFALTGAVYVAASGLPPSRLALAIGIAQAAGMFGAWAGQWVVSVALRTWDVAWQSIWVAVVGILVLLALCIAVSLPGRAPAESQPASVGENAPASVLRPLQILFCESSDMVLRDLRRRPVRADCDRRPHLADSLLQHGPRRPIPASGAECIDGAARAGSLARLFWAGCRIASVAGSRSSLRAA
jgi:MFS family permease